MVRKLHHQFEITEQDIYKNAETKYREYGKKERKDLFPQRIVKRYKNAKLTTAKCLCP